MAISRRKQWPNGPHSENGRGPVGRLSEKFKPGMKTGRVFPITDGVLAFRHLGLGLGRFAQWIEAEMRRLTLRYKRWLVRRATAEVRKRKSPRKWVWGTVTAKSGERLSRVLPHDTPPVMSLDTAYRETIGFIHDFRLRVSNYPSIKLRAHLAHHGGRIGWIRNYQDFKSVREISPAAALLMAAEYDRTRLISGPLAVVDLDKWDPEVRATLGALGFFELLDLPELPQIELASGIYIQRLTSERGANSKPAIDQIVDLFEKAGGDEGLRLALCGAVVDALENVRDHAYPAEHFVGVRHVPNWWFTGAADKNKRSLILGIYDQGITIPVSLPRRFGLAAVTASFAAAFGLPFDASESKHDGRAIEIAMQLSESSTGERHRGKGLSKIKEVVSRCGNGQLRIVSRNGEYLLRDGKAEARTHDVALPGTYVEIAALF
jgi:hypothetical protein